MFLHRKPIPLVSVSPPRTPPAAGAARWSVDYGVIFDLNPLCMKVTYRALAFHAVLDIWIAAMDEKHHISGSIGRGMAAFSLQQVSTSHNLFCQSQHDFLFSLQQV